MELLQLKYFCVAAETQNFSLVARKYNVPASNISQTISRLENELNVRLFDRTSNKIVLNANGENFYKSVKNALDLIDNAKNEMIDTNECIYGEIKILICTNRRIVTNAIEKYRLLYPDVSFILCHSNKVVDDYDIIVSDNIKDESNYNKQLLLNEKILLASADLPDNANVCISDLCNQRFITMGEGTSMHNITNRLCSLAGFIPNIAIQSDDPFYIRKYIELGLGIAFVPGQSWHGQFSECVNLIDVQAPTRNTYIFTRKNGHLKAAVRKFVDLLMDDNK